MVFGAILILWGVLILNSSVFKMKRKEDYEDDARFVQALYRVKVFLNCLIKSRIAQRFSLIIYFIRYIGAWVI